MGYVAPKAQWDSFNWKWEQALRSRSLDYLHTSHYLESLKLYRDSPDVDVYKALEPFIAVIQSEIINSAGFGVCAITECAAWDALSNDEKKWIRAPELNSFETAIGFACIRVGPYLSRSNPIAIQMDESVNAAELYERYRILKQQNQTYRESLGAR